MTTIKMTLPVAPRSVQHGARAKVQRGRFLGFYNDKEKTAYMDCIVTESRHHAPQTPMQGMIRWEATFYLERAAWAAQSTEPMAFGYQGPDDDNLQKSARDALTKAGFWRDDGQIYESLVRKAWVEDGLFPRIEILIEERMPSDGIMPPGFARAAQEQLSQPKAIRQRAGKSPSEPARFRAKR